MGTKLLEYLPEYDMVVGERSRGDQASIGRAFGNKIFNWLASYVAKFPVHDLTSGFRAVKSDIANKFLHLLPNTYSYPTTLTLCVLRDGRSLKYVPVKMSQRNGYSNSHFDEFKIFDHVKSNDEIFNDYHQNLHPFFSVENFSSGKLSDVHFGIY